MSDALRPDWENSSNSSDSLIGGQSHHNIFDGLIRHDKLLTDSLVGLLPTPTLPISSTLAATCLQEVPVVKTEHSYSMAGSDGDSLPDSPLSVNDTGM